MNRLLQNGYGGSGWDLFGGGLKGISEPSYGADTLRVGGVLFDLLPQAQNIDVDRAVGNGVIVSPHSLQQLLADENGSGAGHQDVWHSKLSRRKTHSPTLHTHLAGTQLVSQL